MTRRLSILLAVAAFGQEPPSTPVFDGANISVSKPGNGDHYGYINDGQVVFRRSTLTQIIAITYGVDDDMVLSGPKWMDVDRFDISAKTAPTTPDETAQIMFRALLQDRFKLAIHREDRPKLVYVLSIGKHGSKLQASTGDGPGDCQGSGGGVTLITVKCKNLTAPAMAEQIRQMAGGYVDHRVVDETGLKGSYDFTLSWTARGRLRKPGDADYNPDNNISFFEAVEKLGLTLMAQTHPASMVIVDRAEKPVENATSTTKSLPPAPTEFEVASIRPSKPGATEANGRFIASGQLDLKNMPLKDMITLAYDIRDDRLVGLPKWAESDRYDVVAKTVPGIEEETMRALVRALLADRFGLRVHHEDQPISVYGLAVGKGGKLKEASGSDRPHCQRTVGEDAKLSYTCANTTIQQLVEDMPNIAPGWVRDHPIVDLTGLTGSYDFVLTWSDRNRFRPANLPADPTQQPAAAAGSTDPTGAITFFEGVEKLGLKLTLQKHPMPVVVVDNLNRTPTEN